MKSRDTSTARISGSDVAGKATLSRAARVGYVPMPGRREYVTIALLALEIVIFALLVPNFLHPNNISTVLRNAAELAIVSIGMTMVMVLGGIDVSVGSALGVVAIVVAWQIQAGMHPLAIALVALVTGMAIGLMNGALVTWVRIPAIITTLGTMNILRAAVFGMLGGRWITGLPPVFAGLTAGSFLGVPVSVYLMVALYLIFWYLLTFTPFGRHIYAVGNNAEAAVLVGINVKRTQILTYMLLGSLVGVASLLYVGRLGSVEITVGQDLAIQSIAAVVIGGTSVLGGRGSLVGTLAGVLFMAFMRNGIVLLGVPSLWERAIIGALVILSAAVDLLVERRTARHRLAERAIKRSAASSIPSDMSRALHAGGGSTAGGAATPGSE